MVRFTLRLFHFIAVAAAILLGPSIAAEEPTARHDLGESMPQVLYASYSTHSYATWVAAAAALDPSGDFDDNLFHPQILGYLNRNFSEAPDSNGCIHAGPVYHELVRAPDWGTRAKVLANSELVVQGKVVGKEYGFKGFSPGQLLRIRADNMFKAHLEHLSYYYVFFPVGDFSVGNIRICKTDPRFPPPPEIGDELIVSVPYRSNPDEPLLKTDIYGGEGYITLKGERAYWSAGLTMGDQKAAVIDRGELLKLMNHVLKKGD